MKGAPYGISYMSDSADGEFAAVAAWAEENPDIDDIVLFTMSEDESQENTTRLFQDTLGDIGLNILEIVDIRMNAQTEDYVQYAIQALNCKADYYDAVTAICRCDEEFGVTSENYRKFMDNEEIVQWFYNSEMMDGIQKDFYWSEGKK